MSKGTFYQGVLQTADRLAAESHEDLANDVRDAVMASATSSEILMRFRHALRRASKIETLPPKLLAEVSEALAAVERTLDRG